MSLNLKHLIKYVEYYPDVVQSSNKDNEMTLIDFNMFLVLTSTYSVGDSAQ